MSYDSEKEYAIEDDEGNAVKVFYDSDLVYHEHYYCTSCFWHGDIDHYSRHLERCPECDEPRSHGFKIEKWRDGAWQDARELAESE